MKTTVKIIALLGVVVVLMGSSISKVYVCDSPNAAKYHLKEDCKGLAKCTHKVVKMTVKEAQGLKLELCGYED